LLAENQCCLAEQGYTLFPNVPEDDLLSIAMQFGTPSGDSRDSSLVKPLMPQTTFEAKPNTLSSRYGAKAFPLHTETAYWRTPARFLAFYCSDPGAGRRRTLLVDTQQWELDRRQLALLRSEVWKVVSGRNRFLCTLFRSNARSAAVRFDKECMTPAVPTKVGSMVLIRDLIAQAKQTEISWNKGDLLIVDNHRILHGRSTSQINDPDRRLLRILLKTDEVW
jgi:L-asparagine oxygenase